jgi:uncharacterized membrane protein (DUF373 family)
VFQSLFGAIFAVLIILDAVNTSASSIAALGLVTLVLGIVCWLLRSSVAEVPSGGVLRHDAAGR